jgi:hypothetical protein
MVINSKVQKQFDNLVMDDFVEIANQIAPTLDTGTEARVLVNICSAPNTIFRNPVCLPPEYKHAWVEYENGTKIFVMFGLD